jgi:maltose O-acetyltransferase
MPGCFIDYSHCWHIQIGDDVGIAANVIILAHDGSMKRYLNYTRIGKVVIGNRVFIGAGSIILPGVTIGNDVVIGAGSIVSRDIPDNSVASGNPAKVVAKTDEYLERKKAEMMIRPCFSENYTLRRGVTPEMKAEMNKAMKDRIGYII